MHRTLVYNINTVCVMYISNESANTGGSSLSVTIIKCIGEVGIKVTKTLVHPTRHLMFKERDVEKYNVTRTVCPRPQELYNCKCIDMNPTRRHICSTMYTLATT